MIVLAHAGHWVAQLLYLLPVALLGLAALLGRLRGRRKANADAPLSAAGQPEEGAHRREGEGRRRTGSPSRTDGPP